VHCSRGLRPREATQRLMAGKLPLPDLAICALSGWDTPARKPARTHARTKHVPAPLKRQQQKQ